MKLDNLIARLPKTEPQSLAFSFVFFALLMSVGGIIWSTMCFSFGFYTAGLVPTAYCFLSFFNVIIWIKFNNFQSAKFFQVVISILLPFLLQWVLGGYYASGIVMIWGLIGLIAALILYNSNNVFIFLLLFIGFTIFSFSSNTIFHIAVPKKLEDPTAQSALFIINFILVSSIIFFLSKHTLERLKNTLNKVEMQHKELLIFDEELKEVTASVTRKNKNIEDSINYARRIQEALLPQKEVLSNYVDDSFIMLKAKDKVSGDFYWFDKARNKLFITAVDCTGHGVPGAIISMVGIERITAIVNVDKIDVPSKILDKLNIDVIKILKQKKGGNRDGMDLAFCVWDKEQKILEFAGAKNPLIYIQDNELHIVKGDRQPIGLVRENIVIKPFTNHSIPVDKETVCYIFSDGFQDQFGRDGRRKFSIRRLRELLLEIHQLPMPEQEKILYRKLCEWVGCDTIDSEKQIDDILVMGFKIIP